MPELVDISLTRDGDHPEPACVCHDGSKGSIYYPSTHSIPLPPAPPTPAPAPAPTPAPTPAPAAEPAHHEASHAAKMLTGSVVTMPKVHKDSLIDISDVSSCGDIGLTMWQLNNRLDKDITKMNYAAMTVNDDLKKVHNSSCPKQLTGLRSVKVSHALA